MNKINVNTLLEYLNYSDLRAVRKWCEKNKVFILKQGKCEFVMEINFKQAYELPLINKLKKQYGNNWESIYKSYAAGNIPALNSLQELTEEKKGKYNPTNEMTKKYQLKFLSHAKKKAA